MDRKTVRSLLDEQLGQIQKSALQGACAWQIEQEGLVLYIRMRPRGGAGQPEFLLKASFDDFSRRAPSCVFVDKQLREHQDSAWPPNVRHGAAPPGICTPGTREFHENYHANDRQYPWDAERYPFLQTLMESQRLMERGLGAKK